MFGIVLAAEKTAVNDGLDAPAQRGKQGCDCQGGEDYRQRRRLPAEGLECLPQEHYHAEIH